MTNIPFDYVPHGDTEELAMKDLTRCLKDKGWRLNNLYWVKNENGEKVKFKFNPAQLALWLNMHCKNLILKARQMGITTYIQIYQLDEIIFNPDTNAGVIAQTRGDATTFFKDKIKYAYDALSTKIRESVEAKNDSAQELRLNNGSVIIVGTSLRSGTYQLLHISEFGKICAKYPEKAREIVTGALNTVHDKSVVFIESTAEGRFGRYYEMCEEARLRIDEPGPMEYKLHFFPWFFDPKYKTDQYVFLDEKWVKYFDGIGKYARDNYGIELTEEQKAWYVLKSREQKEDMNREYPSTPEEAFLATVEGAYYGKQMAQIRAKGQILRIPIDNTIPIHTFWDLGRDTTVVWFFQEVGFDYRFIDYYENDSEGMPHYIQMLKDKETGGEKYNYGDMYLPHDGDRKGLSAKYSPAELLYNNKFDVRIVTRTPNLAQSIERVRQVIPMCYFDKDRCALGINRMDGYRKERDEKLGTWKKEPMHDINSHGADGFRTFVEGYQLEKDRKEYDENEENAHHSGRNATTGY